VVICDGGTGTFSGVHVTLSFVLCVCFADRCLSFCTFSFGNGTLPEHLSSLGFSGVRVTLSLVLCVSFVDRCLSFCTFSVM
jgi:hypothetical protein